MFIHPLIILTAAAMVLGDIPECRNAEVYIMDNTPAEIVVLPNMMLGAYLDTETEEIYINPMIQRKDLLATIYHECGHLVDKYLTTRQRILRNATFGEEPYYTKYSEHNDVEDFAESYSLYMRGRLPRGDKYDFFYNVVGP